MDDIVARRLRENKPKLSEISIKTYQSVLSNLRKKMGMEEDKFMKVMETKPNEILRFLKDKKPQNRKTVLAVMVSVLGKGVGADAYRKQMLEDANEYNSVLRTQHKTEKQQNNWLEWQEVLKIYDEFYKETYPLFRKRKLDTKDLNQLVALIILSCYVLLPPRRSRDYTEMKLKDYDKEKDNYYEKGKFHFLNYKTAKNYGEQIVKVPPKLRLLLKRWEEVNPTSWLIFDSKKGPMAVSRLTFILNKIFGKNISTSMLRHIFLSNQLKDTPTLNQRDELAREMGHSVEQADLYRKI